MNYLLLLLWVVFLNCFVACEKTASSRKSTKKAALLLDHNELSQAKNFDTPVPLGYKHLSSDSLGNIQHHVYEGNLSIAKTKEFYLQEMERLGWDIVDLSTKAEALLFCNKTMKQCTLSIRPYNQNKKNHKNLQTSVHIFVHIREHSTAPLFPFNA